MELFIVWMRAETGEARMEIDDERTIAFAPRLRVFSAALLLLLFLLAAFASAGATADVKWTASKLPPVQGPGNESIQISLNGISCPDETLCVAVGGREGTLAFSQSPSSGAESWHWTKLAYPVGPGKTCAAGEAGCEAPSGALQAVSCASPRLCALVTYDGWIFVSTDPSGGTGAWSGVNVNLMGQKGAAHLMSVSCPTTTFCAAVSGGSNNANGGRILTSTDPTGGQWQTIHLGDRLDLRSVSCGTPSLCVAAGSEGRLFVSTDPTGGASAWKSLGAPGGPGDLEGASCVGTALCAIGNMTGNILTSTDAAAGSGGHWSEADAGGSVQITGVSCPAITACLAVDDNGDVMTSTNPTGGASSWRFENLVPFTPEGEP
ncbi:MAG TPA: hypothetical protein VLC07_04445, partial [Solirubrobacterales bacterium]|nr:hypothetical protein [Solirubrobacterales bacterium]